MTTKITKELRSLLCEAHEAYTMMLNAGGNMNEDFASFATRWIDKCRLILDRPDLTEAEFSALIRQAQQERIFKLQAPGRHAHVARYLVRESNRVPLAFDQRESA